MKNIKTKPFQIMARVGGFRHAIRGILRMIHSQHNAWIHFVATILVVASGIVLRISGGDWCWIVVALSMVWIAEAFNTALEFLADAVSPEFHPLIRDAKDAAAGGVLVAAVAAAIIGSIVFWPHVMTP